MTTKVTAQDMDSSDEDSIVIENDYVLITDGSCEVTHIQEYATGTHIITIKAPARARSRQAGGR